MAGYGAHPPPELIIDMDGGIAEADRVGILLHVYGEDTVCGVGVEMDVGERDLNDM
jgi:hypothetical protein